MELGLEGKTVIVTGGASNIGRAISHYFCREKCNVAIADIDREHGEEVAQECRQLGVPAIYVHVDLTSQDSSISLVKQVVERFGTVHVLCNNAGVWVTKPFVESTAEEWERQIRVNYFGTVHCSRAVLDYMIPQRWGRIISTGSDAGRVGENRQAFYSGTKGAVIAFTKALAKEVGRYNITANCVCPGITPGQPDRGMWLGSEPMSPDSEQAVLRFYPMRRLGRPDDLAAAYVFLASEQAGFITGQTLSVSGGYSMV